MTTTDWYAVFVACGAALQDLGERLTSAQHCIAVPATPDWTVVDVYAHLAGVGTSLLTGSMHGAPGPAWTAQHVERRRGTPISELVAEIRSCEPALAGMIQGSARPAVVWDRAVHLADLGETLGLPRMPAPLWEPILEPIARQSLADLPIKVHAGSHAFGPGPTVVDLDPYELFRVLFSRRSRAQVRAVFGQALNGQQCDGIQLFGQREDDPYKPA